MRFVGFKESFVVPGTKVLIESNEEDDHGI